MRSISCCIAILLCLTTSRLVNAGLATMEFQSPEPNFKTSMRLYDGTFQDPLPSSNELTNEEKQRAVKDAFLFAWNGYKTYSWGFDENRPVTNSPLNSRNGWGATIVDSLDTLYIMGLTDEFKEAREFVAAIDWGSTNDHVQVFETCIRYVGGLLSAYDLSHDYMFAAKAADLVERLLPAFTESPTGIPYQYVNFKTGKAIKSGWPGGVSCLAEVGAIQLEFTRLSQITGDWKYHNIGQRVYNSFDTMKLSHPGLYPHLIDPDTGAPASSFVTWGGMGDSFYEYLIKQYIFSQSKDDHKKKMMIDAVDGLKKYMMQSPKNHDNLLFIASLQEGIDLPVMDELACFAPSALLLSARFIDGMDDIEEDAKRLLNGCYTAWTSTRTGIAPEVFAWISKDGSAIGDLTRHKERLAKQFGVFHFDPGYILRPETLESIYYFHQLTQEQTYQDMAWEIFNALHTYCRANSGFSGIDSVDTFFPRWDNRQESFVFAETFKYLYLMWDEPTSSSRFPLDQWVFNTEGHPFRIANFTPPTLDEYSLSSSPLSTVNQDTSSSSHPISQDLWNWFKKNLDSIGLVLDSLF